MITLQDLFDATTETREALERDYIAQELAAVYPDSAKRARAMARMWSLRARTGLIKDQTERLNRTLAEMFEGVRALQAGWGDLVEEIKRTKE